MKHNHSPPRLSEYLVLATILLLGLFFRVRQLGDDPFFQDQAATSMGALRVTKGSWPLVGPMAFSFDSTLRDPPLPSYLYAIPFAISGDPRVARIFTALWNLFSIAIAYKIGRRYFGRGPGVLVAALYASHPTAVVASRFIWNPNLAAPFVMLYVYTGLLGYYESKSYARVLHLPVLALAILCHPSLSLLAPLTLLLWLWAWWNRPHRRRALLAQSSASTAVAILLITPWLVGNLQLASLQQGTDRYAIGTWLNLQMPDLHVIMTVLAGEGCWRNNCPMLLGERPQIFMTHLLPAITLLATAWALLASAHQRRLLPPLTIIVAFYLVPLIAAATGKVSDHYVWPLIGNATIIQAAFFSTIGNYQSAPKRNSISFAPLKKTHGLIQWPYALVITLTLIGNARFNFLYDPKEDLPSLNQSLLALNYALKTARHEEVELILQDYQPPNELRCKGCRGWETLPALLGEDLRILPQDSGFPAPITGAILMRSALWPHRESFLLETETINKWFQISHIPLASDTPLDIAGAANYKFANGALVIGLTMASPTPMPHASEEWRTILVWQAGSSPETDFKFFAHLVDSNGTKYAQVDPLTLPKTYWRSGQPVLTELKLDVADSLPADGPLFIRFGMYDHHGNVPLIDTARTPKGEYATIQIRGAKQPVWVFGESLALNEFDTASEHQQGPPIFVDVTWEVHQDGLQDKMLRWVMITYDGQIAFETLTDLVPVDSNTDLPAPAFVPAEYALRIPTDITPGPYSLNLQAIDNNGHAINEAFTTNILITPRARNFKLPPMQNTSGATFAGKIMLAGYDLKHSNHILTLTLHWQALAQIPVDYKYFVHVSTETEILAQVDAMPDSYRYPTSWWAPHEVFSDTVTIDLGGAVSKDATVQLGLYEPNDGRIPITDRYGNPVPSANLDLGNVGLPR